MWPQSVSETLVQTPWRCSTAPRKISYLKEQQINLRIPLGFKPWVQSSELRLLSPRQRTATPNPPEESGAQTNTGSSNMEVVEMYKRYTDQIQFEANRRPQKRVFIVIHELQEELGVLRKIFSRQDSLLYWYMNEITPHSSDIAYDVRRTPFLFEEKYIQDQRYILNQRESEIDRTRNTAAALELHVGRMIEILEEDHGKAIRVFTVVTLFFLPL
jgi:hypothetical protein